jgi:hypothetical protein
LSKATRVGSLKLTVSASQGKTATTLISQTNAG